MNTEPKINIEFLNKAKDHLVRIANEHSIDLGEEFRTVEAFKKFVIAATFKAMVDGGMSVEDAWDQITFSGSYKEMEETAWAR